jgi:DNA-binding transcriptional ArsR family regulator
MTHPNPLSREIVLDFLKNTRYKYTVNQLYLALKLKYGDMFLVNYPIVSNHVEVLSELGLIHKESFGVIRVVWYGKL